MSVDGRTLAFGASVQGKRGLWVRPLDGITARLLPGTELAGYPFWSPDGNAIAYFAAERLWRVELAGGAPVAVCEVGIGRGGAWASNDTIIFASLGNGLRRVSASGGSPTELTRFDVSRGETAHYLPQMIPGGRFLYWVRSVKPENNGVYAASLSTPRERVRLMPGGTIAFYSADHLLYLRGSTLVARRFDPNRLELSGEPRPVADPVASDLSFGRMTLAASAAGVLIYGTAAATRQLTWFDRAGKALGTLGEPATYFQFALAPDGRRVVVSRSSSTGTDLWTVEIERNVLSRFTFAPGVNGFPAWSPDGRTIAFSSGAPLSLFRKDASGAGTEQRVFEPSGVLYMNDWSRDGRFLLYHDLSPDTRGDLWVAPVTPDGKPETGAQPRPYLRTRFSEQFGQFSPEPTPRWVAYQSDETGRNEIYIQAFPEPKGKWQVSSGGGVYPRWSPGGKELFYLSQDNKLMSVALKLGVDSVDPSTPRELFPVSIDTAIAGSPYAVSPDGRRFLVRSVAGHGAQPLQVIVNWPALLKQ